MENPTLSDQLKLVRLACSENTKRSSMGYIADLLQSCSPEVKADRVKQLKIQ